MLLKDGETKKMEEAIVEKAIESLGEIKYTPFATAYFVRLNGDDIGEADFCATCIDAELKRLRKSNKENREAVKIKFDSISATGVFVNEYGENKKIDTKYSQEKIAKARRYELKQYPVKAKFDCEEHDPDFGGGLTEPHSCYGCGEYFRCEFNPSDEEMKSLEYLIENHSPLSERDKWEIDAALNYFPYATETIKKRMLKICERLINK